MKTKLLRKIRARFNYTYVKEPVWGYYKIVDKKTLKEEIFPKSIRYITIKGCLTNSECLFFTMMQALGMSIYFTKKATRIHKRRMKWGKEKKKDFALKQIKKAPRN